MERVAVIIVNYNAGSMLQRCLDSLAAQRVPAHRVLVIDNASRDGSFESARELHPWAEFHQLGSNQGFARANNLAVERAADCEWVALLNPDAFPEPGWLEAFHCSAVRFVDTDAFASCMLSAGRDQIVDGAGDCYRVDGIAWPRLKGAPLSAVPRDSDEVFSACAGAGFYRRAVFLEAGGFDERFFCYYEDVDLGFRMRLMGYRCRFLPDAIVYHVGSAVSGEGSDFSVYHVHRNVVWSFLQNMPSPYVWVYLPAHILINLLTMAAFVRKARAGTIFRAKWHALRALPAILRRRRRIQQLRRVEPTEVIRVMQPGNAIRSWALRIRSAVMPRLRAQIKA